MCNRTLVIGQLAEPIKNMSRIQIAQLHTRRKLWIGYGLRVVRCHGYGLRVVRCQSVLTVVMKLRTESNSTQNTNAAVALAFEEMHTPYASGRTTCVHFGNAYQRKEVEETIEQKKSSSQTMRAFLSQYSSGFRDCVFWGVLRPSPTFLRTLYASLPWFCVELDFYAYFSQKCALTRRLQM